MALPNTEEVNNPVRKPDGCYNPMAFGAISRTHPERSKYAGTYDDEWIANRMPFWPDDFDFKFFQSAPLDQQIPYIKGGELVELLNLSPKGIIRFKLPTIKILVFYFYEAGGMKELCSNIDTLILEPDHNRFTLTARSILPLVNNIFDITEIIVGQMPRSWYHNQRVSTKKYYSDFSLLIRKDRAGVCRHIDLMTHNHGSDTGNTAPFPFLDGMDLSKSDTPCHEENKRIESKCKVEPDELKAKKDWTDKNCDRLMQIKPTTTDETYVDKNGVTQNHPDRIVLHKALEKIARINDKFESVDDFYSAQEKQAEGNDCLKAKKCELVPKKKANGNKRKKGHKAGCCNGQTGHHVVPHAMASEGGCTGYEYNDAPCICVEGNGHSNGSHKTMHKNFAYALGNQVVSKAYSNNISVENVTFNMKEAMQSGTDSVILTFPESGCSEKCIQAQLEGYFNKKSCNEQMALVGEQAQPLDDSEIQVLKQEVYNIGF